MSKKYSRTPAPLTLDLIPSRYLLVCRIAVALVAAGAVVCTPFSWLVKLALLLVVVIATIRMLRSVQPDRLQFDGQWRSWRDGEETPLQLDGAVVWPMLIVLRFRGVPPSQRRFNSSTVVLLPDSVDRDGWRRLRVHLQHGDVFAADQRAT